MKQTVLTAEMIYEHIRGLEGELREIEQALEELEDHKGKLPYKMLDKAYNEKYAEVKKAKQQKYELRATSLA